MAKDLDDRVVYINRVSKAASGGTTMSFSTMVAVGDQDGQVGIGIGQDEEVPESIEKARVNAEKNLESIQRMGTTIPHEIEVEHDAARVLLKPASPGTGVIAGGAVRSIVEMAGINDILTKSLGSDNPLNIARATLKGLKQLKDPHKIAQLRDVPVEKLLEENPFASGDNYMEDVESEDSDEDTVEEAESDEEEQAGDSEDSEEMKQSEESSGEENEEK
ncbi:MAG: 30S ribosomal protein S5, partial [bacterium]